MRSQGENGFGYDPIFFPSGVWLYKRRTFTGKGKNELSHRGED